MSMEGRPDERAAVARFQRSTVPRVWVGSVRLPRLTVD